MLPRGDEKSLMRMKSISKTNTGWGNGMYISYDYYRVFYYVAKYGSITQAAKILLNSQPNLTRTIKTLESEWGVHCSRGTAVAQI